MKKTLYVGLLIATALVSFSCSENDNTEIDNPITETSDPVVGTWTLIAKAQVGAGLQEAPTSCERQSTMEFRANKTFTAAFFDDQEEACVTTNSNSGTWENIGEGMYEITEGDTPLISNVTLEEDTLTIDFDGGNNVIFKITLARVP